MISSSLRGPGRVDFDAAGSSAARYDMTETDAAGDSAYAQGTVRTQDTPVSRLFFSAYNVDLLQDAIRYRVYVETDGRYTIGRQSDIELNIVMRSVYLQHGKNLSADVPAQVRALNALVLDFCVPRIVREVQMYVQYRQHATSLPMPLDRGELATSKGTRTLVMTPGFA